MGISPVSNTEIHETDFNTRFPFLLAGCPSVGDRIPVNYVATVSVRGSTLCVTMESEDDERLEGISIYLLDEAQNRALKYFDPLREITPNQYVPTQGYVFTPEQNYHFSVKLTSSKKDKAEIFPFTRELVTEFSVQQVGNQLRVATLPPVR
ncbi:hypothetical protein MNO11_23460 [Serratia plymuthica]|uniref:putative T6SS immunity periplasmic lipoprotein n=1 Tax=Serratia plymuthica TaxID=82996 RepID=UPI001F534D60|nr:putative T6SS immunity periplasmic lipoprotein [Serratia plymuthica]UNK27715.1 hypothetical protein MNO11_23460 [Serratia plymuthica]